MAGAKVSEFQTATPLTGDEIVGIVQDGENAQTTAADIAALSIGGAAQEELIRDTIATALTEGAGIDITIDDGANTITIAGTVTQYTDEMARDAAQALFADSTTIDVTVSDPGDSVALDVIQTALKPIEQFVIALSDETTSITTGNAKMSWAYGYDFTITEIYTILGQAQSSSGAVTVDVNKNGSTILSTKPSIDANESTSLTGTAAVISTATSTKGDIFTADVDAAGTGAKGLKLIVVGHRT